MKKILIMVLILVMVISFVGCGANESTGDKTSDKGVAEKAEESESAEAKVIKIGHGASESYHMHRALVEFKAQLEKDGMFVVEIYPSSQFGNDAEMIESVKKGDITMAVPPSSFLTDEAPEMALIELPYVFPSRDHAIETLKGEWGQSQLMALEDAQLHGLGYLENGLRHLTNSKLAVKSPEDLKGLKLRTMQVPAHVYLWNDLGATAEGAPFAELYTNLSTKVFDGQENPVAHIYSQKFFEVQDYITLTGHVYTAYVPLMGLDFWNSLNDAEQTAIDEAFELSRVYQLDLINAEESAQLDEIAANTSYPTEVIELTVAEKQVFIDAAQPTLNHYREEVGVEAYDRFADAVKASK